MNDRTSLEWLEAGNLLLFHSTEEVKQAELSLEGNMDLSLNETNPCLERVLFIEESGNQSATSSSFCCIGPLASDVTKIRESPIPPLRPPFHQPYFQSKLEARNGTTKARVPSPGLDRCWAIGSVQVRDLSSIEGVAGLLSTMFPFFYHLFHVR